MIWLKDKAGLAIWNWSFWLSIVILLLVFDNSFDYGSTIELKVISVGIEKNVSHFVMSEWLWNNTCETVYHVF